nr:hypothetical protein HK105_000098 [Polyrhizophydium stewartii]
MLCCRYFGKGEACSDNIEIADFGRLLTASQTSGIWNLLVSTQQGLKSLFPHRIFKFVVLDEYNSFKFLPSLLRPIKLLDSRLATPSDIAAAVACIPFKPQIVTPSERTRRIQEQDHRTRSIHNQQMSASGTVSNAAGSSAIGGGMIGTARSAGDGSELHASESMTLSAWYFKGNPAAFATETFFGQVASPSSMLLARAGSLLEHACFLCSAFLGRQMNAFVAVGEVKRRPYVWVVTIASRSELSDSLADAMRKERQIISKVKYYIDELETTVTFERQKFLKLQAITAAQQFKEKHLVLHWDPLTGVSFEIGRDSKFPFDRLDTLFNSHNVYFNVQSTNMSTQLSGRMP